MSATPVIPVVLFAYARVGHLRRTLASLRENAVPRLYVYADGPRSADDAAAVKEVRTLLAAIDWCEVTIVAREANFGLGRNVREGVDEVASRHDAFIVWEDDLVAVPGAYAWLSAALRHYHASPEVMSVTAWAHPRIIPTELREQPYFDGRAECWVWGAYARSWRGMDRSAREMIRELKQRGIDAAFYGADLPAMAREEARRNIWAVRWLYHHLAAGGLCLRPPWSMVEHIGFDATATNAGGAHRWQNQELKAAPAIPIIWPEPREHPQCAALWRRANPVTWRLRLRGLIGHLPP